MNISRYRFRKSVTREKEELDFTKYIPFVSAGLMLLGVTKLTFYYGHFGVNILSFLEFDEILTSFLRDIVSVYFMLGFFIFYTISSSSNPESITEKFFTKEKRQYFIRTTAVLILFCFFMTTAVRYIIKSFQSNKSDMSVLAGGVMVAILYILVFRYVYTRHTSKLMRQLSITFGIILICGVFVSLESHFESTAVEKGKANFGTRIIFNNETFLNDSSHVFVSDSSTYYIGKTKNYIFIYNEREYFTSVYPMSNVISIDLKRNRH